MRCSVLALSIATLTAAPFRVAAAPRVVVVFDIENKGAPLSAAEMESLTDYLGNELGASGQLRIVPRSEIRERLRAGKMSSYKSCYDQKCQIEIGRELAAQMTVATRIGKVGKSCVVTAALYDLKTAASSRTATATATCEADAMLAAIAKVAKALREGDATDAALTPATQTQPVRVIEKRVIERQIVEREVERKSVWVAVLLSFLPGGGMYYVGKPLWGALYTAAFIGGTVALVSGFKSENTALTVVGALGFYGSTLGGAIHAGVAAAHWRPPGEKEEAALRWRGARLMMPLVNVSF